MNDLVVYNSESDTLIVLIPLFRRSYNLPTDTTTEGYAIMLAHDKPLAYVVDVDQPVAPIWSAEYVDTWIKEEILIIIGAL